MGAGHLQNKPSKQGQAWLGDSCVASTLVAAPLQPLLAQRLWQGGSWEDCGVDGVSSLLSALASPAATVGSMMLPTG